MVSLPAIAGLGDVCRERESIFGLPFSCPEPSLALGNSTFSAKFQQFDAFGRFLLVCVSRKSPSEGETSDYITRPVRESVLTDNKEVWFAKAPRLFNARPSETEKSPVGYRWLAGSNNWSRCRGIFPATNGGASGSRR